MLLKSIKLTTVSNGLVICASAHYTRTYFTYSCLAHTGVVQYVSIKKTEYVFLFKKEKRITYSNVLRLISSNSLNDNFSFITIFFLRLKFYNKKKSKRDFSEIVVYGSEYDIDFTFYNTWVYYCLWTNKITKRLILNTYQSCWNLTLKYLCSLLIGVIEYLGTNKKILFKKELKIKPFKTKLEQDCDRSYKNKWYA